MRRRAWDLAKPWQRGMTARAKAELRRQRCEPTPAEACLWAAIRRKQLGIRFRNRHVIAGWFVDFYAPSLRLAIELDGRVHQAQREYDAEREAALEALGVRVFRASNEDVLLDLDATLARIAAVCGALKAR